MTTNLRRDEDGTCWWGNQRFIWFGEDEIHVDATIYARARGISQEQAYKEIEELFTQILPKARRHHVID